MKALNYPLDTELIWKKRRSMKKELLKQENFLEKKVAILSGSTIGDIKSILELFLLNQGIKPIFYEGLYGRFYEEAVYDYERLIAFKPDIIYIHTTNRNIERFPSATDTTLEVDTLLINEINKYKMVWDVLKEKCNCTIIQNNFELLNYRISGNGECYRENGSIHFINLLNEKLYEYARENSGFLINDIHYLSSSFGLERWHDDSMWYMYKYALSLEAIPRLCSNLSNIIKALYGKSKKSLILDLDNTLWGGVIGDDGPCGIQIGNDNAIAESYMMFQKYIKGLKDRGILLNVCSKNNESIAKQGFEHHSSVLKVEDFVGFKANWDDKATNVQEIITQMNIGVEHVVFLDDNPVERELVKNYVEGVEVPELLKVEDYIQVIDKNGYFEMAHLEEADLKRNLYYQQDKMRQTQMREFKDYNIYLKSLDMKCFIENVNPTNLKRSVQLINKTNQFNLTTHRYNESEIEAYIEDENILMLTGRLEDKFGDNGLVTVMIVKQNGEEAEIDLWVMSCRVFKRNLEYVMFKQMIKQCKSRGIKKLRGIYKLTNKNIMLKDFYLDLGFKEVFNNEVKYVYELDIDTYDDKYLKDDSIMEVIIND